MGELPGASVITRRVELIGERIPSREQLHNTLARNKEMAVKIAVMNAYLYALLWPASFYLPTTHTKIMLISTILVSLTLLSLISPKAGITATFLTFLIVQLPAVILSSEPFIWMFYLMFMLACVITIGKTDDEKKTFKRVGLLLLTWLLLANIYYKFPYRIKFSPETAVISLFSLLMLRKGLKWFGTSKLSRMLIAFTSLTLPFVWTSTICLVTSVPSPLQSIIANRQRGVTTLLPAWRMPGGARVFAPTDEGWLVGTVNLYKDENNGYSIHLLDEDGKPIRPPIPTRSRLNEIGQLKNKSAVWLIPGVNRATLCTLDVDSWKPIAQTKLAHDHTHAVLSPSGDFVATYAEQSEQLSVFRTPDLTPLTLPDSMGNDCQWVGLNFIDDSHILGYCRAKSSLYVMGTPYLYELRLDEQKSETATEIAMPLTVQIEGIDSVNGKAVLLDSGLGRIYTYDTETKQITKQKVLYIPTLRYLKRIDSCNILCAAGELGIVVLLDYDLNVKKTLFCGSKIKSIYVRDKRIYLASQAGLVEINLEELAIGDGNKGDNEGSDRPRRGSRENYSMIREGS